jgi:uncharacterized protein
MPGFHDWAGDKRLKSLVFLVLILAAVALSAYSYYTWKQSKYVFSGPTTINVTGKGEVEAKPDLGTFTFSVRAETLTQKEAQEKSADSVNKILAYLKGKGVEEKDIKTTNYSLQPKVRWEQQPCTRDYCPPGKEVQEGFIAEQWVEVRVRDLGKAGELIGGVGENGGTNVSQLSMTFDDMEAKKSEARGKAIADAKAKADQLAKDLGVRIVRMTGYWENDNSGWPVPMYGKAMGMDGDMAVSEAAMDAPQVPVGENKVVSTVTITYEIK